MTAKAVPRVPVWLLSLAQTTRFSVGVCVWCAHELLPWFLAGTAPITFLTHLFQIWLGTTHFLVLITDDFTDNDVRRLFAEFAR